MKSINRANNLHGASEMKALQRIYLLGFITTVLVVFGSISDVVIGMSLGGDLSEIPSTAVERFSQFQANPFIGLYYLDLLNVTVAIVMIPTYFAIYAAHRSRNNLYIQLSLMIFVIATAIFISNNQALPMLELSNHYASSTNASHRELLAAAGEALLVKGAHGSLGAFIGFALSSLASIVLSYGMLKGGVFTKLTAYLGLLGSLLLLTYLVLVTWVPGTEKVALIVSAPGGLLSIAWLILTAVSLFKLSRQSENNQF